MTTSTDIDSIPVGEVCSAEEAEHLVETVVAHTNGLLATVFEMIRKQAWIALGYTTIADLLKSPQIAERIINPATQKPYSRQHLDRMGKAMNMLSSVAIAAGVDPAEVNIDERRLRQLKAQGILDVERDIVADIEQAKTAHGANALDADQTRDIVDSHLNEQHTEDHPTTEPAWQAPQAPSAASASQDSPGEQTSNTSCETAEYNDADYHISATDVFDGEVAEQPGQRAVAPTVSMRDAMAGARDYVDTTAAITALEGVSDDLRRLLTAVTPAVDTAREAVGTFFKAGQAGHTLATIEQRQDVLAQSLSDKERAQLSMQLRRVGKLAPLLDALITACESIEAVEVTSDIVVEVAPKLKASELSAGQVSTACEAVADMLDGDDEDDLDDLLADLGL